MKQFLVVVFLMVCHACCQGQPCQAITDVKFELVRDDTAISDYVQLCKDAGRRLISGASERGYIHYNRSRGAFQVRFRNWRYTTGRIAEARLIPLTYIGIRVYEGKALEKYLKGQWGDSVQAESGATIRWKDLRRAIIIEKTERNDGFPSFYFEQPTVHSYRYADVLFFRKHHKKPQRIFYIAM